MEKHLVIGRRVKILDQKNRGGVQRTPSASFRVKQKKDVLIVSSCRITEFVNVFFTTIPLPLPFLCSKFHPLNNKVFCLYFLFLVAPVKKRNDRYPEKLACNQERRYFASVTL